MRKYMLIQMNMVVLVALQLAPILGLQDGILPSHAYTAGTYTWLRLMLSIQSDYPPNQIWHPDGRVTTDGSNQVGTHSLTISDVIVLPPIWLTPTP